MTTLLVRVLFGLFVLSAAVGASLAARRMVAATGQRRVSGVPLALFRIGFGVSLLCEIAQLHYVTPMIGTELTGIAPLGFDLRVATSVWAVVVVLLVAGYRTRLMAVLSYAFTLATFSTFTDFEYHVDYVFTIGNAFMILAPVSARFSVDRLRAARSAGAARGPVPSEGSVADVWHFALVLVGIAFVYADSVFHKFASPLWTEGLGMWLPASVPYATWFDLSPILDLEWVARALGYLVLVFELVFLVAMWWRRTWPALFVVGVGLHVGILVAYPIPWFAFAMLSIYAVMLPPGLVARLGRMLRRREHAVTFVYDGDCPLCRGMRGVLAALDVRRAVRFVPVAEAHDELPALRDVSVADLVRDIHAVDRDGRITRGAAAYAAVLSSMGGLRPLGWALGVPGSSWLAAAVYRRVADARTRDGCGDAACAVPVSSARAASLRPLTVFLAVTIALQVVSSTENGLFREAFADSRFSDAYRTWRTEVVSLRQSVARPFFGITAHGVFVSHHFEGRRASMALVHVAPDGHRTWLPIQRENGLAHPLTSGRLWVLWNFRVVKRRNRPAEFARSIARVATFWMARQGLDPREGHVLVLAKEFDVAPAWERGALTHRRAEPWREVGRMTFRDGVPEYTPR